MFLTFEFRMHKSKNKQTIFQRLKEIKQHKKEEFIRF